MWQLILNPETHQAVAHNLTGRHTIGRADECSIVVRDHTLSRTHATLNFDGGQIWIRDEGSKNGTFVQGQRVVGRIALRDGDRLRFGPSVTARLDGPSSTAPLHSLSVGLTVGPILNHNAPETTGRLQVLLEVAGLLGSPMPIAQLLARIVALCLDVLSVDVATVELPTQRLALSRSSGQPVPSQSIIEWVRSNRAAGLFPEAATDPRLGGAQSVLSLGIGSSMAAPLIAGDTLFGVLYVDRRRSGNALTPDDLSFLLAFASQAALALAHADLQAQVLRAALERQSMLRFFPPSTAEHLLAQGSSIEVIETEVTALFCDITGYTDLSEDMSPREVIALLNRYFAVVVREVFDRGGTLEKYIGDAVFAVWGAPVATPLDADLAVGAALAIRDAVRAVSTPSGVALTVHVGLHTGMVAAGNVGTADYLQYATVGSATNLAARLCSTAAADEVVVSEATWNALGGRWEGEALEAVALKGVRESVGRWRVRGRRESSG